MADPAMADPWTGSAGAPELPTHLALLLILAALMHAAWNAMLKGAPDRLRLLTAITATYGSGALLGVALLAPPAAPARPFLVGSACVHQVYRYALARMYDRGDLSRSYPVARGAAPLLTTLAMIAFGEIPSLPDLLALAVVAAGLVGLGLSAPAPAPVAPVAVPARDAGIRYALLIAAMIACYTVLDGFGARRSGDPLSYVCWLSVLDSGAFVLGALLRRGPRWLLLGPDPGRSGDPGGPRALLLFCAQAILGGALSLGAYAIALYAATQGAVGVVAALRESSVIFAAILGAALFREPFGPARVLSAVVVTAGLLLLQAV